MHVPPIRQLRVLIDPTIFAITQHDPGCGGGVSSWVLIKTLENYLGQTGEGLGLQFILPRGWLDDHTTDLYAVLLPTNRIAALATAEPAPEFFEGCTRPRARLIAIANQERVHLVLSEDPELLRHCSSHLPDPPVLALGWAGFTDVIECFLLGHGVYFSFTDCAHGRWLDTYYQTTNRMNEWLLSVHRNVASSADPDTKELLRSFAYNRYPFILLARGLLQFYRWQALWYKREGGDNLHAFVKTFHLNWLYLLMWGALDHLCLLLNRVHSYGFKERRCGLNKDFRQEMKRRHSELAAFLETEDIARFLMVLSDLRHAAAHRIIPMPTSVLQETEES
ncbi:MAG: hypothetical protein HY613_06890, partial [Candidatus Rokubacteria bacterium]|nr:hypothetical protein [Candidatus Rokubacteria bacterium]